MSLSRSVCLFLPWIWLGEDLALSNSFSIPQSQVPQETSRGVASSDLYSYKDDTTFQNIGILNCKSLNRF